jgi:hypothetical protein
MSGEGRADRLPGGGIPQPQSPVVTATKEALAIGAKGHRPDPIIMPGEGRADRLTGGGIPEPQSTVETATEEALAIGAKGH